MWSQSAAVAFTGPVPGHTGGHDYKFVEEPPESLKCLICLCVAKDPQQHGQCGKLFCKSCIAGYRFRRNDCPHCRRTVSKYGGHTTIFNDFKSDQEVKSLKVYCKLSCGWQGELGAMEDHVDKTCENARVQCPNSCNNGTTKVKRRNLHVHIDVCCPRRLHLCEQCQQKVEYQHLKSHQAKECPKREYACPKCDENGCYDERTTTHLIICPKVEVQCPKCSLLVFRCDCRDHHLICQYEPVTCKYFHVGCSERPLRKDLDRHENNAQVHLAIAAEKVRELTLKCSRNMITFKMAGFGNIRASKVRFYSPHFFTSRCGYKLCLGVDANGYGEHTGTHISTIFCLMKGDNDDSLTWPFTGRVTVELLNQLEDKNHHKITVGFPASENSERVVDGEKRDAYGQSNFIPRAALAHKPDVNCQYLKDDTLVFRVSAEAPDYKPWLESTQ